MNDNVMSCVVYVVNRPLHIPVQLIISMHIFHTIVLTSPQVRTRRFCLTIKSYFSW